jgi:ABC-type multidrug transport system fused ATPase/permease subunit
VCINTFTFALGIGIISIAVINGKASIGDIAFVGLLMTQISSQTLSFGRFLDMNYRNDIKVERMLSILDAKPTFTDSEGAKPVKSLESISFDNVSFDYPDGKKGAVKNLSFDIGHNKTIALVGPSGVGKSTITKLILSFYQPTKGKISINDHPSTDYKQESVRSHIAMVMQDVALFNTTIRENLNLANPKASFVEIEKAARLAHAHEFIKDLPKGYDTLVGERGVKLSGGQKQRIAIARAILKDPQLIILDEATSALDSESERLVQDGLKKLMQGRSALVIAHRLSTVMHADEILVLEKGTIIERGTHHELMKLSGGLYKKLFEMQSSSGKVAL